MTTENATSGQTNSQKLSEAFYTGSNDGGPKVSLFINENRNSEKVPNFSGTIGDKKVGAYIRGSAKGPWIALTGERDAEGKYEQVGSANIIVNKNAKIRMSLKLAGSADTIWVSISDKVSQEMLVECGLNLEILEAKRAEVAAAKPA